MYVILPTEPNFNVSYVYVNQLQQHWNSNCEETEVPLHFSFSTAVLMQACFCRLMKLAIYSYIEVRVL